MVPALAVILDRGFARIEEAMLAMRFG